MRRLTLYPKTRKCSSDRASLRPARALRHTNHHVDVLRLQAIEKLSSQADSFKVHKHSSKNFKSILRNHLKQNPAVNDSLFLDTFHVILTVSKDKCKASQNHRAVSREDCHLSEGDSRNTE